MQTIILLLCLNLSGNLFPKLTSENISLKPDSQIQEKMENVLQRAPGLFVQAKEKQSRGERSAIFDKEFVDAISTIRSSLSDRPYEYIRQVYILLNTKEHSGISGIDGYDWDLIIIPMYITVQRITNQDILYAFMECYGSLTPTEKKQYLKLTHITPDGICFQFFKGYLEEYGDIPWTCVDMMFDHAPNKSLDYFMEYYISDSSKKDELNKRLLCIGQAINSPSTTAVETWWPDEVYEQAKSILPELFDSPDWWLRLYAAEAYQWIPRIRSDAARIKMKNSSDPLVKVRLKEITEYDAMKEQEAMEATAERNRIANFNNGNTDKVVQDKPAETKPQISEKKSEGATQSVVTQSPKTPPVARDFQRNAMPRQAFYLCCSIGILLLAAVIITFLLHRKSPKK